MSTANQACQNYRRYAHMLVYFALININQDHIKRHAKELRKHNYTLLLVPRVSTLVSRILEEEGVLGDVTISSYNLQFIPIAEDVISLEHENAMRELWVVSEDLPYLPGEI